MKPARRLVTGAFDALEPAFLEAVREARAGGPPLAPIPVLVPSNLLRAHLRMRLAEGGGAVNVRFYLVPDLARALAPPGLAEAPSYLDDLVLEGLLDDMPSALGPFGDIRDRPGLREALLDAFSDLEEAGIGAPDLARAIKKMGARPGPRGGIERLRELGRLYAAYREALARLGFVETPDVVLEAARSAARAPLLASAPAAFAYGFYDLTAVQVALLEAVAAVVPTTVYFPWLEAPAFAYARPTLEALRAKGFDREEAPAGGQATGPRALAGRLFAGPAGSPLELGAGEVEVVSCPGEAREAREAARAIAARARADDELRLERVAVLPRRLAPYRRALATAFAAHGLPAALARPLAEGRCGRTLLALLEARRSGLGRREVMALLDVADFPEGRRRPVAYWDRLTREAGVVAGREEWDARLGALAAASRDERRTRAIEELRAYVLELASSLEAIPVRGRPSALARAAVEALRPLAPEGEERARVLEALSALGLLDAARREVTLERLFDLALGALGAAAMPLEEEGSGGAPPRALVRGVVVADLMAARGVPFDLVWLPGLVERSFPAPAREDPVLLDAERAAIGEALGKTGALRPKTGRVEEERLLFALACASARQALVLSYPRIEAGTARERVASSFLLATAEAATGARADYRSLPALPGYRRVALSRLAPDDPREAETGLEYDLATAALEDPREVLHLALDSPLFARGLALDHARWSSRITPYDGLVGPLLEHPADALSPSRLETWAHCPLRYFFQYGLGIRPPEEPEAAASLDPLDRGTIVHAVLFDFLNQHRVGLPGAEREALGRELLAAAERGFAVHERTGITGPRFLWELEKASIREDLLRWLKRELDEAGDWVPTWFEVRFGPRRPGEEGGGEDPASFDEPVAFDLGDGRAFAFKGRIDRIDLSRDGKRFRVIDYKTGSVREARPETLAGGRALQLPIYILAARALLERAGLAPRAGRAEYFFVSRRGGFRRVGYGEEGWTKKSVLLRRAARLIADGIRQGAFAPEPEEKTCRFCDYLRICGSSRARLHELKAEDPARRPFEELRGIGEAQ